MEARTYRTLELDKVIARLAEYAEFSASRDMLVALEPTADLDEAVYRQNETAEARRLLDEQGRVTIGGARDVREAAASASRDRTLTAMQLVEVRATLEAGIRLRRLIERSETPYTLLEALAVYLYEGHALISAIGKAVDANGEVLDSASAKLANIRRDLRQTQDDLRSRLNRIINSRSKYLQEAIITTRGGRYVIPVKAEARGRVDGIIHDQSASGATLYIEPQETVPINNRIRELELAERDEILRILQELSALVGRDAEAIIETVEALAALDAAFARAKYANRLDAAQPTLTGFDEGQAVLQLIDARHPLIDPEQVVAIDLIMDGLSQLIITGPNTGGKTVSLKTAGLLVLMAQCGLHIPASEESVLTVFEQVHADIGDEQSIEQSLSTFSGHMTNIIRILAYADERSLVIFDELGSGTDPAEGAAIARAILDDLRARRITTLTATHYPELKLYAHGTPGVRNASVEFDVETLSPTYRLIIGLPGRSNALAIASRLGLPEPIIETARGYIGESDLAADDLLDEIYQTRAEIRETREELAEQQADVTELQRKLKARLARIEEERQEVLAEARQQAEAEIEALRDELDALRRRLKQYSPAQREELDPAELVDALEAEAEAAEREFRRRTAPVVVPTKPKHRRKTVEPQPQTKRPLQVGDRVYVHTLDSEGEVLSLDDEVEVQVGVLRVRVKPDQVERRGGKPSAEEKPEVEIADYKAPTPKSPGLELDMRGMRVEEGMLVLEDYIDRAYLAGLPWARILHGKGSGALRKAVREKLHGHELIKDYKAAPRHEGGDGVTVVYFAELV